MTAPHSGKDLGKHHRRAQPGAACFINYFRVIQLYAGNEAVEYGVATQALLRCVRAETVEDATRLHAATETTGPAPRPFQFIRMQSWRNARSPLASYASPNRWLHANWG